MGWLSPLGLLLLGGRDTAEGEGEPLQPAELLVRDQDPSQPFELKKKFKLDIFIDICLRSRPVDPNVVCLLLS